MKKSIPSVRYQKTNKSSISGGYGHVEIWHDSSLDRDVAIKWTSPEYAEQLLSEVRALSQRPSAHIVEIYDLIFTPNGDLEGIVLEYLDGAGLESLNLNGEANLPRATQLLYQMAQGLADLHAAGLVHRDVKPANAVCNSLGRLKLVDFGLSGPGVGAETLEARGTLGFAAPELFSKAPIAISVSMDVYSFGMVCWKKLTGKLPKVGSIGFPEYGRYPLPSLTTKSNLSAQLATVLDSCVSWDPMLRPSMRQVADAFMAELTFGKHTASIIRAGSPPYSVTTDPAKISTLKTGHGTIDIGYDGYKFSVRKIQGAVSVNNKSAVVGQKLDAGCLLTFGGADLGGQRSFVPFRQSSPEIIF